MIELQFESTLHTRPEALWQWACSREGIGAEMPWWFQMNLPTSIAGIADVTIGKPIARCWLQFAGLPYGITDLTLIERHEGQGFIEQSPMTGMNLWRHKRWLEVTPAGTRLTDTLSFQPRFASAITKAIVSQLFRHRHSVLRQQFGNAAG